MAAAFTKLPAVEIMSSKMTTVLPSTGAPIRCAASVLVALEGTGDFHERARGVDLIVHHDRPLAMHLADDVEHLGPVVVAVPSLLHDGQWRVDELGEGPGALREA